MPFNTAANNKTKQQQVAQQKKYYFDNYVPYVPIPMRPQGILKKGGKQTIVLTNEELRAHFQYPLKEAADRLNVSQSTLKRRYWEMYGKQTPWPYGSNGAKKKIVLKTSILYLVNDSSVPATVLDRETLNVLYATFLRNT
jgi:hypothetical protein